MDALEAIYANVCGLDVHKKTVVACRRRFRAGGKVEKEVKTFATTTSELLSLLEWLDEWQVSHVAMDRRECIGSRCGTSSKAMWTCCGQCAPSQEVPGRKTDVKDGEW